MRKIEQAMVAAVASQRPWSQDNTRVDVHNGVTRVYLHGFRVGRKDGETIEYDANWKAISR